MASLYEISDDILRIFNEVELSDGEITDEQYDALVIKQEELKDKLENYVKAIKSWEVDEKALKDEKKRFNDRQNVFKNRITRLKQAALDAVIQFGEQGKSNRFIELPNFRIFTKSSQAVEINEERINLLISEFERYIRELVNAGCLCTGKDIDLQGFLDAINANIIAAVGSDFKPFTISDLEATNIKIYQSSSLSKFMENYFGHALRMYGSEPVITHIENDTTKDNVKDIIEYCKISQKPCPTVGKVVINQSLQIK